MATALLYTVPGSAGANSTWFVSVLSENVHSTVTHTGDRSVATFLCVAERKNCLLRVIVVAMGS